MILFFILAILLIGAYVLVALFAPEALPWYRPHLILERPEPVPHAEPVARQPYVMEGLAEPESDFRVSLEENVTRLETILYEKNRTIEKLQKELLAERSHRQEFEKVKAIMDQEIQNLKLKNKQLKTQPGEKDA